MDVDSAPSKPCPVPRPCPSQGRSDDIFSKIACRLRRERLAPLPFITTETGRLQPCTVIIGPKHARCAISILLYPRAAHVRVSHADFHFDPTGCQWLLPHSLDSTRYFVLARVAGKTPSVLDQMPQFNSNGVLTAENPASRLQQPYSVLKREDASQPNMALAVLFNSQFKEVPSSSSNETAIHNGPHPTRHWLTAVTTGVKVGVPVLPMDSALCPQCRNTN